MSAQTHVRFTRTGVALAVGIIILTIALIAGLLYVKDRGEQARNQETLKVAEENLKSQANQDVALNSSNEENTQNENKDETKDESKDQSSTEGQETQETEDQTADGAAGTNGTTGSADSSNTDGSVAAELPQTGAADSLWILALGAVAFASVSFIRSKRALGTA